MKFNFDGTQAQQSAVSEMADTLTTTLGDRLKDDVTVVFKPADKMKKRSDGGPSNGFWTRSKRVISLRDEIDEYNVVKTFAHEVMHVVDADWLTLEQRKAIVKLMKPPAEDWGDMVIDGDKKKYVADPSEVFAVYASAAVAPLEKPAYTGMYLRSIDPSLWKDLRAIVMRDQDAGDRGSKDDEEKVVPPDTAEELEEQLDEAKKKLTDAKAALAPIQAQLTAAQKQAADAKAELAPTQAQLEDAKTQLTKAQKQLADARAELAPTLAQLGDAKTQLADAKKAMDGAKAEAKAARDELAPTQAQLADAKTQLADAKTQAADAMAQLAPVQAQLTEAQSQLTTVQAQLTEAQSQLTAAQTQAAAAATQAAAQLADAIAAKDVAEQGRAQAGMKLAQAKQNASDIRAALTAGDTLTATTKATEIGAL